MKSMLSVDDSLNYYLAESKPMSIKKKKDKKLEDVKLKKKNKHEFRKK